MYQNHRREIFAGLALAACLLVACSGDDAPVDAGDAGARLDADRTPDGGDAGGRLEDAGVEVDATVPTGPPIVGSVSGAWDHGATVTLSGGNFGVKATAAPIVWDDASGEANNPRAVLDKWAGYWPDASPEPEANMMYKVPFGAVGLPHSHITQYLTGAHADSGNFHTGQDVMVWANYDNVDGTGIYVSFYYRVDARWTDAGSMTPVDGNFKRFDISAAVDPYASPNNWYEAIWSADGSGLNSDPGHADQFSYSMNDDTSYTAGLQNPQEDGGPGVFFGSDGSALNPFTQWIKAEYILRSSAALNGDGRVIYHENNRPEGIDYTGRMDGFPGTLRAVGIGGFARACNSIGNRRYFADLYVDTTRSGLGAPRVVLADSPTYSSATITELQVPSAWSTGAITATVNLGRFTAGQMAYVFVFDANNEHNAVGFPVVVGS